MNIEEKFTNLTLHEYKMLLERSEKLRFYEEWEEHYKNLSSVPEKKTKYRYGDRDVVL